MHPLTTAKTRDFRDLSFGVEQEHFVFKNGVPPTLSEMKSVFTELVNKGFNSRKFDADGMPLVLGRDLPTGYLAVKNDFCTHVLEAAFPPHTDMNELEDLFSLTWVQIDGVLRNHGIERQMGGALDAAPQKTVMIPHERLNWMTNRCKPLNKTNLWHLYFTTLICATQIHIGGHDEPPFSALPTLYSLEYLFPLLFTNSRKLLGQTFYCSRPLAWRDNFSPDYKVFAIPEDIPASKSEYGQLVASSSDFVRDYCFIAPRAHGTIEFRSTCSQDSFSSIRQIIALRIASLALAKNRLRKLSSDDAARFYSVCDSGSIPCGELKQDLAELEVAAIGLPEIWVRELRPALVRIEQLLGTND